MNMDNVITICVKCIYHKRVFHEDCWDHLCKKEPNRNINQVTGKVIGNKYIDCSIINRGDCKSFKRKKKRIWGRTNEKDKSGSI